MRSSVRRNSARSRSAPFCGSVRFSDCMGAFAEKRVVGILKPGGEKTYAFMCNVTK